MLENFTSCGQAVVRDEVGNEKGGEQEMIAAMGIKGDELLTAGGPSCLATVSDIRRQISDFRGKLKQDKADKLRLFR